MKTESIFDSASHPTLDGQWTQNRRGTTFESLASERRDYPNYRALAIGLPFTGEYEHKEYKSKCDEWGFEPIAGLTNTQETLMRSELELIAGLGYRGVKIHPRLLGVNQDLSFLTTALEGCVETGLVCLLCTYEASEPGALPNVDPFYQLCSALNRSPDAQLILMHGGVTRLLQYANLARHSPKILLDLSFTMMKYSSSSLDADINYLVNSLDARLCVGSDSPEYSLKKFFARLDVVLAKVAPQKRSNILSSNLLRFFPSKN